MLRAPEVERHWALFLDLDGTLLDIAAAPNKVVMPARLIDALAGVSVALDGALAVVSGRKLRNIDRPRSMGLSFAVRPPGSTSCLRDAVRPKLGSSSFAKP